MNHPSVSVVIPNYNYGIFLAQAIDSVLAQTYPNIEIIVIDDGSTDASEKVLDNYGDKIRWFKQTNGGVSRARNRGISESGGDFIAFLDADDIWLPEKIERQLKLFADDSEIGLVHCGFVDFDNAGSLAEHLDGMEGWVAESLLSYRRSVILGGGSATVVKRKAIDESGGFDENMRIGEDWEFYYRIAKNYKVGFVPQVLLKYRIHPSNSFANNPSSIERMEKDLLYALDKIMAANDTERINKIKNLCYGRIHAVIAGSYFRRGAYSKFLRHTIKSLHYSPAEIARFAAFPLRRLRRQTASPDASKG